MTVEAKLKQIIQALYVERDPKRRIFFTHAHAILYARRHNQHHDRRPGLVLRSSADRGLGAWLLYHATPDDFRALADALAYDGEEHWRLNVLKAYVAALKKCDPNCRDIVEPSTFIPAPSPITWAGIIRIKPTIPEVKKEFVRLFGERCLPDNWRWKMRDLIQNTFKLPLRVNKTSRKRISRLAVARPARATKR